MNRKFQLNKRCFIVSISMCITAEEEEYKFMHNSYDFEPSLRTIAYYFTT